MDVSELRKRILRALDEARKDAASKRTTIDEATRAYEQFLETIAVPLLRQSVTVLRAQRQLFTVNTPATTVRLVSDAMPQTFLELSLDTTGDRPQVMGHVSLTRGRQAVVVLERPIAPGRSVAETTEDDVAKFLVEEIPKLMLRP